MDHIASLLGQVGIDLPLLIAQIINFGILLWILKVLIYKPIIQRIESDEKQLQAAKLLQEKLEKDQVKFQAQKKTEMAKARKLSRQTITEAEALAEEIKKDAQKRAEKQLTNIVAQMKKQVASKKKGIERAQLHQYKEDLRNRITDLTRSIFLSSSTRQSDLNSYFLGRLDQDLKNFPAKTFSKKQPSIIFENASELVAEQKQFLQEKIDQKFGHPVKITEQKNPELICGYRLEIDGVEVEDNLFNEINNALQETQ